MQYQQYPVYPEDNGLNKRGSPRQRGRGIGLIGVDDDEFETLREVDKTPDPESQAYSNSKGHPGSQDAGFTIDEVPGLPPVARRKIPGAAWKLLMCLVLGLLCGVFIDKSRIPRPHNMRSIMFFRNTLYLKVTVTTFAVGQLVICACALIPGTRDRLYTTMKHFSEEVSGYTLSSVIIGSIISGIGIVMCGSCPITLFSQLGSFTNNAGFTGLGALIGALLYGMFQEKITKYMKTKIQLRRQTIFGQLGIWYPYLALPVAGFSLLILYYFRYHSQPWYRETHPDDRNLLFGVNTTILWLKSWPPYVAGAALGLTQFALVYFLEDTLDLSRAVQTLSAQWLQTQKLREQYPYLAQFRGGVSKWWPVMMCVGIFFGSMFSSMLSQIFQRTSGVPCHFAFVGGLIMMFGARMAGGPSRHVSGASMLFFVSLVAVPCILIGGHIGAYGMRTWFYTYVFRGYW